MRRFQLRRLEDETGISGVGIVAEGIQFSNGRVALSWLTDLSSVAIYDNTIVLIGIHGHNGKTLLVWIDQP